MFAKAPRERPEIIPCPNKTCDVKKMHARMVDYTCKRLGQSVCFIYTCARCSKQYSNLRCLSADKCKVFRALTEPSLSVWYLNSRSHWQLECRGRTWVRCDNDNCCAIYLYWRGKTGEHTKDKCVKSQAENAAANNASVTVDVLSARISTFSISQSFSFSFDTGSIGPFSSSISGGGVVESGQHSKSATDMLELTQHSGSVTEMPELTQHSGSVTETPELRQHSGSVTETPELRQPGRQRTETLQLKIYGPQRDSALARQKNLNEMLAAGYFDCNGVNPKLQQGLFEQMWSSMDDTTRANILSKLMGSADQSSCKRDLPRPASPTVESKRHHPGAPADEGEAAMASVFTF